MSNKRLTKRQKLAQERDLNYIMDTKFSMKRISPITATLKRLFDEYNRGQNLLAIGTAGTGKTYSATYLALKEVLEGNSPINKVLFVRSAVQSRDQGFMPGNQKEKEAYYELPFIEIVNDLFERKDAYNILKQKGTIEFRSTSFIRGLTFDNTIVILDESQNCHYEELRTVITRLGNNSKIILCGDTKQDDLAFSKNRVDVSGLGQLKKVLNGIDEFSVINFTRDDIVRSELIKKFIIAEEELELA
jgi:phosphate starvation-inducible PhoH-like protein